MVDKSTASYRKDQFANITGDQPAQVKVRQTDGETKWLSISNDELKAITELLTDTGEYYC